MYRRAGLALALTLALGLGAVAPVAAAPAVKIRITAAPSSIALGSLPVNEFGPTVVFYVTNQSRVPLRWLETRVTGDNQLLPQIVDAPLSAPCDQLVDPGETCAIAAQRFMPVANGQVSATVVHTFTDGGASVQVTVIVKARGV